MHLLRVIGVYLNHFSKVIKEDILTYFRGEIIRDTEELRIWATGGSHSELRKKRKQRERLQLLEKLKNLQRNKK